MAHAAVDTEPQQRELPYHERCCVRVIQSCLPAQRTLEVFDTDTTVWSEEQYQKGLDPKQRMLYLLARKIWVECKGDLPEACARAGQS